MSEKFKNIDDLFKNKFEDFEVDPPEHIWGNIKQGIQDNNAGGSGKSGISGGTAGISVVLLLVGLFLVYQFYFNAQEPGTETNLLTINQEDIPTPKSNSDIIENNKEEAKRIKQHSADKSNKKNKKENKQKPRFDLNSGIYVAVAKKSLAVNGSETIEKQHPVNLNNSTNSSVVNDNTKTNNHFILIPGDDTELLAMNSDKYIPQPNDNNPEKKDFAKSDLNRDEILDSENQLTPGPTKNPEIASDYGKKNSWAFGLSFTPEMNFYPNSDIPNNRSYSIDVQALYKFSGYFLQSGLGISMTSDEGNYKINYNKYLGSYDYVYDVTFDTSGNQVTPIYHTEPMKVYDSINHVSISPTKSKYNYLQIPILFGYGNEGKRFGWFVKGGPSISILISENVSDYTMSDAKILNVDSEMPGRIKTNWQIVLSGGLSYRVSNNLSLAAEPMFRYYIKSAYENSSITTKKPYSLGLRLGLLVDF